MGLVNVIVEMSCLVGFVTLDCAMGLSSLLVELIGHFPFVGRNFVFQGWTLEAHSCGRLPCPPESWWGEEYAGL